MQASRRWTAGLLIKSIESMNGRNRVLSMGKVLTSQMEANQRLETLSIGESILRPIGEYHLPIAQRLTLPVWPNGSKVL